MGKKHNRRIVFIGRKYLCFNRACLDFLGNPDKIMIMIDRNQKRILIKRAGDSDSDAITVRKGIFGLKYLKLSAGFTRRLGETMNYNFGLIRSYNGKGFTGEERAFVLFEMKNKYNYDMEGVCNEGNNNPAGSSSKGKNRPE